MCSPNICSINWIQIEPYGCASHVKTTLKDSTYKLVPELEEGIQEGQVNVFDANQVPWEPETNFVQEGQSRSMTWLSRFMQLWFSMFVRLSFQELIETLVA